MDYKDIERVNSEIEMIDMKGKNYAMVPERVTAFRKIFPDGFIETQMVSISPDGKVVSVDHCGFFHDVSPLKYLDGRSLLRLRPVRSMNPQ